MFSNDYFIKYSPHKIILLAFVFSFFFPTKLHSQIFDFSYREVDFSDTYFMDDYIKDNKIKSVQLIFSEKFEGERIVEKDFTNYLFFKPDGKLHCEINCFRQYNKTLDSTIRYFYFDSKNRLFSIRKIKNNEYTARYFTYDDKNRLLKKQEFKETVTLIDEGIYKVESQELINTESFYYEDFSKKQYKKHYLNDTGKEYKYAILNLNDSDQVADVYESFSISGVFDHYFFKTDNHGKIVSLEIKSNTSGDFTRKWLNIYEVNLLKEQKLSLNDDITGERYLFYQNGLLDSELTRKIKNKQIDLVKYVYTFFN